MPGSVPKKPALAPVREAAARKVVLAKRVEAGVENAMEEAATAEAEMEEVARAAGERAVAIAVAATVVEVAIIEAGDRVLRLQRRTISKELPYPRIRPR